MRCAVNPVTGRERDYDVIKPAEKVKRVMVIGAGPAGMEAARVAGVKGHNVTLYEKTNELGGGQLKLASTPPHKEVFKQIPEYYSTMFEKLNKNVKVELGKEVTASDVVREKPDAVIVATGGSPLVPDFAGTDRKNVVTNSDILSGKAKVGDRVVVVGGRLIGCETANFLAAQNKKVTIVEMHDDAGTDIEWRTWIALREELSQGKVRILTETRVDAVVDEGVMIVDKAGHRTLLEADTVVLSIGVKPNNELAKELAGKVAEICTIGDASEPGRIIDAVHRGFITAYKL